MDCFKCGSDEHLWRDCPERASGRGRAPAAARGPDGRAADDGLHFPCSHTRAQTLEEHQCRIDGYVADWAAGRIGIEEKRMRISDENRSYYGDKVRKELTWP